MVVRGSSLQSCALGTVRQQCRWKDVAVRPVSFPAGASLIALLLVVLTHAVLGPMLICYDEPLMRTVVPAAVAVSSEPAPVDCPECVRDSPSQLRVAATPTSWPVAADAADPCTSDHPCQHAPVTRHSTRDGASRALASPRVDAPEPITVCPPLDRDAPSAARVSPTGPVPLPAALAPVAVLCVDRN